MLNSFRCIGITAAMVVAATVIGVNVSAADPKLVELDLANSLEVTVEVTLTGDNNFKTINGYESLAFTPSKKIAMAPEGTMIHWEARPKSDNDRKQFKLCKGSKQVVGKTTIIMSKDTCTKS